MLNAREGSTQEKKEKKEDKLEYAFNALKRTKWNAEKKAKKEEMKVRV